MAVVDKKIGILGGGQLGRMIIQAGIDFNIPFKVLDPDPSAPCKDISEFVNGSLKDFQTVYSFGKDCDVITIEIEHVNTAALRKLQHEGKKIFPQPEIIELIQDKRLQKQFYKSEGIPTAEFVLTENAADVASFKHLLPAVNKLGREGYDGRGVQVLRTDGDLGKAFDQPGLLENLVDFKKELSVVVARNEKGEVTTFPVVELVYHPEANLVEFLFAPAQLTSLEEKKAREIAEAVIKKLGMVGLLAVELFLTNDGEVLVNEIAPRPHNSGHQTIEANITSQYEQHLRAILGWPLGSTKQLCPAAMVNILGEENYEGEAVYDGLEEVLSIEGAHIHLYGKKLTKPFRKMGHVTILNSNIDELKNISYRIKETLKVKS